MPFDGTNLQISPPVAPDPVLQILMLAKDTIKHKKDWTRFRMESYSFFTYHKRRCAMGALMFAAAKLNNRPYFDAAHGILLVAAQKRGFRHVAKMNDRLSGGHQIVMEAFDEAIAKRRSHHAI